MPDKIPEKLRQQALYFKDQATRLVKSGEKVRAYLINDLNGQPEHAPAYHHTH